MNEYTSYPIENRFSKGNIQKYVYIVSCRTRETDFDGINHI